MRQIDVDRPLRSPRPAPRTSQTGRMQRRTPASLRHKTDHAAVWQWIEQTIAASEQASLTV